MQYLVEEKHAVSNTGDQDTHQTADLYKKYTTTSKGHWFKDSRKFIKKILKSNMIDAYVMNISDYDNNETQFLTRMSKCL